MNYLKLKAVVLAMSLTLLASCGGGNSSDNKRIDDPVVNVSISIVPNSAKAPYGKTTVIPVLTNSADIDVTAPPDSGCARRDSKNIACNPTLAGEYTVTATATADRSKTASVTVTVPKAELENEGLSIDSDGKYELELSADETGSDLITLYAAGDWTAEVGAGAGGEIPGWIDIEDASGIGGSSIVTIQAEGSAGSKISGSAGIVKIAVTLEPNYSGQERQATIIITVGDDSVEITVIQSPTTEEGTNLGDEVSINISPSTAEGMTKDQKTFTVTMENSDDFTLSVIPASGHGCVKSGGNVVCTPTVAGTYEITVKATVNTSKQNKATLTAATKEITIGISTETAGDVAVDTSITFTVTAENTDFSFAVSPETGHGCERDGNKIVCIPTVVGTYEITVTATADTSKQDNATLVVTAKKIKVEISTETAEDVDLLTSITFTVTAENTGFTFAVSPDTGHGCERPVASSEIVCTPTVADTYEITVTASADTTKTATATFTAVAVILEELNIEGIDMVFVENGTFEMGCAYVRTGEFLDNGYIEGFEDITIGMDGMGQNYCHSGTPSPRIRHDVTLTKDFYIGKYEVSQAQWNAVMEIEPEDNPSVAKGDNMPQTNVSWLDVQEFIAALNARDAGKGWEWRLPTEAEWEYAARGGSKPTFCDGSDPIFRKAAYTCWFNGTNDWISTWNRLMTLSTGENDPNPDNPDRDKPEPVDNARLGYINELGLYNMAGNVAEWVYDFSGNYSAEPQNNPTCPSSETSSRRIVRGGSYRSGAPYNVTTLVRVRAAQTAGDPTLGFRLVLTLTGGE